jgi:hypothetical protein
VADAGAGPVLVGLTAWSVADAGAGAVLVGLTAYLAARSL